MNNEYKMFINDEEVISNKEFTIKEEMLTASSTILNNCYPKSWEDNKDYVNNFYFPKDYSKFLLIKANSQYESEEYSILETSTNSFNTNTKKELNKIEIFGNVYQQNIPTPDNPSPIVNVGNISNNSYKLTLSISNGVSSNSQTYVLNEPLRAIGEYKDKLYIENGNLYVERIIGSFILDNTKNWQKASSAEYPNNFSYRDFDIKVSTLYDSSYTGGYSNYYEMKKSTDLKTNNGFCLDNVGNYVMVEVTDLSYTNATDFKNWLANNNVEIQYIKKQSTIENLGAVNLPYSYNGTNYIALNTIETTKTIFYYYANFEVKFAGVVKNSGNISLKPTDPKYCSLQILDYKTFLSESDTLDFVISNKTIAQAISMVVDAISGYGFILGNIDIAQADEVIGAYSTLNKTAYDVFQYFANISGSRWRARFIDKDTMAIDFYDPESLPRGIDIEYNQLFWEQNNIVDLKFNYSTRDYRNKQIILSNEVYGGIDYTELLLSNGYSTSYITQNNIAYISSILVNNVEAQVITQSEKELGIDADFYYTPGKNVIESADSYTAGTQIKVIYTPLVKGRQIVYNNEEVTRIATQTNTLGVISRYENRNDILSSDELENIAETYIKYKGKPEIILTLTTLNEDLYNIGEITYFDAPILDLAQDYMVKSKSINFILVGSELNLFYTYELTSSFNSEKAINYFDNQRNKSQGNIAEGESITRNIDINNAATIIWENATITETTITIDGDNTLNSPLNSPFIN